MEEDGPRFVLKQAAEHKVRFVRLWFTDILGYLKSFAVPVSQLEEALTHGVTFDGSSLKGFARADESDMVALPDPATFQVLPWRPMGEDSVARMFCDITDPRGLPFETDPRYVLRKVLREAAAEGFTFYVGPEIEYYYFRSSKGEPEVLDEGGYFDLTPQDAGSDLRRETILTLERLGIDVDSSHHEVAPSQHEIVLRHTDALSMADHTLTFRLVVKEVARKYGAYATFMPKPLYGQCGSGMHLNLSLFSGDENLFYGEGSTDGLSEKGRHFIAGLLRHAPEMTLILNQWVNSYKRLVPGYEAPTHASWALVNRSDYIRVPSVHPERTEATRIEVRSPDSACNPYLAYAVLIAAGLEGIKAGKDPMPPVNRSPQEMTPDERWKCGLAPLPRDLGEAITCAQESRFLRSTLGDTLFDTLLENKEQEWEQYRRFVTPYELEHYFATL